MVSYDSNADSTPVLTLGGYRQEAQASVIMLRNKCTLGRRWHASHLVRNELSAPERRR